MDFKSELEVGYPPPFFAVSDEKEFRRRLKTRRDFAEKLERESRSHGGLVIQNWEVGTDLHIGNRSFRAYELIRVRSPESYFFWLLREAVRSGELYKINKCSECSRFFVKHKKRKVFCSTDCKIDFFNVKHSREGYVKTQRAKKRQEKLKEARALLRQGEPLISVEEITGLSRRILLKYGVLR
jgi:hypothetical protein